MTSPGSRSAGSSAKLRSLQLRLARSTTSIREQSRSAAGSCAISSGGSSKLKSEIFIHNARHDAPAQWPGGRLLKQLFLLIVGIGGIGAPPEAEMLIGGR